MKLNPGRAEKQQIRQDMDQRTHFIVSIKNRNDPSTTHGMKNSGFFVMDSPSRPIESLGLHL